MRLQNVMATARARTLNERFKKDVEATTNRLLTVYNHSVRVSTKMAKYILIHHETLLYNGILYSTHVRNVGAGVKELYLKTRG